MPVFTINTNLSVDKIANDFRNKTRNVLAASLGKPKSYIMVHMNANQIMNWGGSDAPCASCRRRSIGALGADLNKKH